MYRLCKHPRLDSVTAGTSGEERLALLLKDGELAVRAHLFSARVPAANI